MLNINDILTIKMPLEKLSKLEVPVVAAWKIAQILPKINHELELINGLQRKIYTKHGHESANGEITVPVENMDAFRLEMETLGDQPVPDIPQIDISIADLGGAHMSAIEMVALGKIMCLLKNYESGDLK